MKFKKLFIFMICLILVLLMFMEARTLRVKSLGGLLKSVRSFDKVRANLYSSVSPFNLNQYKLVLILNQFSKTTDVDYILGIYVRIV